MRSMTATHHFSLYWGLAPFAWLYEGITSLRNLLFDKGLLSAESYPLPVICVGNLAVGGTGKTPHVEYLVRLLSPHYRVAVLSRGYKRKTKGYLLADDSATSESIGDEPFQLKRKFPQLLIAVSEKRQIGMRQLLALPAERRPEVVLLDDAFQHRYVKPSLSILLTDSHRLYSRDAVLPVGRLREAAQGARRADLVVVTKCEPLPSIAEKEAIRQELALRDNQPLFFSEIRYGDLRPLFPDEAPSCSLRTIEDAELLLLTGIAHPEPLEQELRRYASKLHTVAFPDHHAFTPADEKRIAEAFSCLRDERKRIVVTEKDAARLYACSWLPAEWRKRLYLLPIEIGLDEQTAFDRLILRHVAAWK